MTLDAKQLKKIRVDAIITQAERRGIKYIKNDEVNKLNPCFSCHFLHIGQNVDHNHCYFGRYESEWRHQRSNGRYDDIVCQYWKENI